MARVGVATKQSEVVLFLSCGHWFRYAGNFGVGPGLLDMVAFNSADCSPKASRRLRIL